MQLLKLFKEGNEMRFFLLGLSMAGSWNPYFTDFSLTIVNLIGYLLKNIFVSLVLVVGGVMISPDFREMITNAVSGIIDIAISKVKLSHADMLLSLADKIEPIIERFKGPNVSKAEFHKDDIIKFSFLLDNKEWIYYAKYQKLTAKQMRQATHPKITKNGVDMEFPKHHPGLTFHLENEL